ARQTRSIPDQKYQADRRTLWDSRTLPPQTSRPVSGPDQCVALWKLGHRGYPKRATDDHGPSQQASVKQALQLLKRLAADEPTTHEGGWEPETGSSECVLGGSRRQARRSA